MALPLIQINLSPHALNAIVATLQSQIGATQNVLQEVQSEIQAWQELQQRAAALAEEQKKAAAAAAGIEEKPLHLVEPPAA